MELRSPTIIGNLLTKSSDLSFYVIYLMHQIPCTGGTGIRNHLFENLSINETFFHLGVFGQRHAAEAGVSEFHEQPESIRRMARIISGHNVTTRTADLVPWAYLRFLTWLRDPAEQIVSLHNQRLDTFKRRGHRHDMGFEEWYGGGGKQ